MRKFTIHVFAEKFDDDFYRVIEINEKFKQTYLTNLEFNEIEDKFYGLIGEGMAVSSSYDNDFAYFKINLIGDRDIENLLEYLNQFEKTDEVPDFLQKFSNLEFDEFVQIDTGDVYLEEEDKRKIEAILNSKGIDYKIIRGNEIYEKGASSYWETYLIALSAGLSIQIIKEIYEALKNKFSALSDIKSITVQDAIKDHLIKSYNLKPSEIYLARFFKRHEGDIVELTFRTKDRRYYVETNSKGEIIEQKVTNYSKKKKK